MHINIDSHQIFPEYDLNKIDSDICYSDNPKTGLFLKENPHLIESNKLRMNKNNWIIDFIFDNQIINYINFGFFSCYNNDKIVDYLLQNLDKINWGYFTFNINNKAVEYLLKNPNKIYWGNFSQNTNNKAVEYLLKNPDRINWFYFSENNNDKIVDYLLENPNKISIKIASNNNTKAVEYSLETLKKINFRNKNDKLVDYILENYSINSLINDIDFLANPNDRVVDIILNNLNNINYKDLYANTNTRIEKYYLISKFKKDEK